MPIDSAVFQKSALSAHFKKAAAHHDKMAAGHEKCMKAHEAHAAHHESMMGKAEDPMHQHHKASASFHKTMATHHETLHKHHAAHSEHLTKMHGACVAEDAKKVAELLGIDEAELVKTTQMEVTLNNDPTPAVVPAAPAKPAAAPTPPTAAPSNVAAPTTVADLNATIQKALETKLEEGVNAALERVLASDDFSKKVDQTIANMLLGKLGQTASDTPIKTFAVPRDGGKVNNVAPPTVENTADIDPSLADLCKVD